MGRRRDRLFVFLHGCPDTRHAASTGEAAAVRAGVRLVAVNRPGYGRSDPHESDHVSVADDVAAVADLLGIDRTPYSGCRSVVPMHSPALCGIRTGCRRMVASPTTLWYGELDANASVRNGRWFAEHVRHEALLI